MGIIFRYVVREDLDNDHLKEGVALGFGMCRLMGAVQRSVEAGLLRVPLPWAPDFLPSLPATLQSPPVAALAIDGAIGFAMFLAAGAAVAALLERGLIPTFPCNPATRPRDPGPPD
eukprot:tig00000204_g17747.t1